MNGWGGFLFLGALFATQSAGAQVLGTSARQLPKGSLKLLTYYQGTQDQTLNFTLAGTGGCATRNGLGFSCNQTGDVELEGNGGMGVLKLVYQPWESFQYYATFGVGEYSVTVPSTTARGTLSGSNPGISYGAGLKAVIWPDTEVTPGIAIDASLTQSRYTFNRNFPGTQTLADRINQSLELWQYQVAFSASKLFTVVEGEKIERFKSGIKLEPYGGLKWTRIQAKLKDKQDGSTAGGKQDTISPFLGLRIPVYQNEGFFAEASFVNGYQYGAGLEIRF